MKSQPEEQLNDDYFMGEAIKLAQKAAEIGEVPVGAIVIWEGEIVGIGVNRRETGKNALAHAELEAIYAACCKLGGWRLHKATLYVTLEPCPMCAGAIINSRIRRVVFGARDPKSGCFGSACDFNLLPFNHRPLITSGTRGDECSELISSFFKSMRNSK